MEQHLSKEEKKRSIAFYKWMDKSYIRYSGSHKKCYGTYRYGVPKKFYTLSELYDLFIQSLNQQ